MKITHKNTNVKGHCVICYKKMEVSRLRYKARGNYCVKCNALSTKLAKSRIEIRNMTILIKNIVEHNPTWASRLKVFLNKEIQWFNKLKDEAPQYFGCRILAYPHISS